MELTFDLTRHNALLVVQDFPLEYLSILYEYDGTTSKQPHQNDGTKKSMPSWMFGLGLAKGYPGSHISGFDWSANLTPLGQAILDKMKKQKVMETSKKT